MVASHDPLFSDSGIPLSNHSAPSRKFGPVASSTTLSNGALLCLNHRESTPVSQPINDAGRAQVGVVLFDFFSFAAPSYHHDRLFAFNSLDDPEFFNNVSVGVTVSGRVNPTSARSRMFAEFCLAIDNA